MTPSQFKDFVFEREQTPRYESIKVYGIGKDFSSSDTTVVFTSYGKNRQEEIDKWEQLLRTQLGMLSREEHLKKSQEP